MARPRSTPLADGQSLKPAGAKAEGRALKGGMHPISNRFLTCHFEPIQDRHREPIQDRHRGPVLDERDHQKLNETLNDRQVRSPQRWVCWASAHPSRAPVNNGAGGVLESVLKRPNSEQL